MSLGARMPWHAPKRFCVVASHVHVEDDGMVTRGSMATTLWQYLPSFAMVAVSVDPNVPAGAAGQDLWFG